MTYKQGEKKKENKLRYDWIKKNKRKNKEKRCKKWIRKKKKKRLNLEEKRLNQSVNEKTCQ